MKIKEGGPMSTAKKVNVLVVGAGPTGLAAAALLGKLGLSTRIIDKNDARSVQSKALGVQAGTLECLEAALGTEVVANMLGAGLAVRRAYVHVENRKTSELDFGLIPSRFNHVLCLAQSDTERLFEEALNGQGIKVERGTELVAIENLESGVNARVRKLGTEAREDISCDFVMGCDGAHSTVRKLVGIEFRGGSYEGNFILGDVTLNWSWPYESVHVFISERGVVACFPIRGGANGGRRYRIILMPNDETNLQQKGGAIEALEFTKILNKLSEKEIQISEFHWLTWFRVNHRMVNSFRRGRIFLSGDAAHIHSPIGGQGMNTGIQDAINLAFKLKMFFDQKISFDELDNYELERRPVAKEILRATDLASRLVLLPKHPFFIWLRSIIIPQILSSKRFRTGAVRSISQIKIAEKEMSRYPI
jgi:3-(3-hydroxy-phenyl)propionate hydroxylase